MELTSEEYRSGYNNLLDIKEKLEIKVKKLKTQLEDIRKQFNSRESYYQDKIVDQKHHFDIAVDALGGVEFEPEEIEEIKSESVLYYEIAKKMKSELNSKTKPYWTEMVNSYYNSCRKAVMSDKVLGLSIKQKEVMTDWLERRS
tara:strand:+ start:189 stop:620 length:432 start_codon:yes stop_codon:yes gene_type:complete